MKKKISFLLAICILTLGASATQIQAWYAVIDVKRLQESSKYLVQQKIVVENGLEQIRLQLENLKQLPSEMSSKFNRTISNNTAKAKAFTDINTILGNKNKWEQLRYDNTIPNDQEIFESNKILAYKNNLINHNFDMQKNTYLASNNIATLNLDRLSDSNINIQGVKGNLGAKQANNIQSAESYLQGQNELNIMTQNLSIKMAIIEHDIQNEQIDSRLNTAMLGTSSYDPYKPEQRDKDNINVNPKPFHKFK